MAIDRKAKFIEYVYITSDYFLKMLITNLLFSASSILVVTIPFAIKGLYSNCLEITNKTDFSIFANFANSFFSNMKLTVKLLILTVIISVIFIYDLSYLALIEQLLTPLGMAILSSIILFKNYIEVCLFLTIDNNHKYKLKSLLNKSFKYLLYNTKYFILLTLFDLSIIFICLLSINIRVLIMFLSIFIMISVYGIVKVKILSKLIQVNIEEEVTFHEV